MTPQRGLLLSLCLLGAALFSGCAALEPIASPPVTGEASALLAEARALAWRGADEGGSSRRELLGRAMLAAPGWVAPARLLDELDRELLLGPRVLEARRRALDNAEGPAQVARASYLLGRLGGGETASLMRHAVRVDPNFAWGHHGLAWDAAERGELERAISSEEVAIELARDPFDLALFTLSLARFLRSAEREEEAWSRMQALDEDTLLGDDAVWWRAQRASFGLSLRDLTIANGAWGALLEVLGDQRLGDVEAAALAQQARELRERQRDLDPSGLRLERALSGRLGEASLYQRALLAHERGSLVSAASLWEQLEGGLRRAPTRSLRTAAFATGRFGEAVEAWLGGLPARVLGEGGAPKSPALKELFERATAASPGDRKALTELGEACLRAGWFEEAQALAPHLAAVDAEAARSLAQRADEAISLFEFFGRSFGKELPPLPEPESERRAEWLGIERFLAALQSELAGAAELLGEEGPALRHALLSSQLYEFSPFAALVHPGPLLSEQDQRLGVGPEGEQVRGLAELGERLGRFLLLGQLSGGDRVQGAVLPKLWTERRSGAHFGVEWSGSVVWCEGVEPIGWAGRYRSVLGAALHDGYWIDVEAVRRERESWLALERQWTAEEVRGLLESPAPAAQGSAKRRALRPLLGEGDRVRLAIMLDRGGQDELSAPSLSELLDSVAVHEQGHLVDRALHLPISAHPLRALRILGRAGFDPPAVLERLEYRAQVVALSQAADPRVSLSECLRLVEGVSPGTGVHARAYEDLLERFLRVLDQRVQREPEEWPEIDPSRALVGQLHLLEPDQVRELGRVIARQIGMP